MYEAHLSCRKPETHRPAQKVVRKVFNKLLVRNLGSSTACPLFSATPQCMKLALNCHRSSLCHQHIQFLCGPQLGARFCPAGSPGRGEGIELPQGLEELWLQKRHQAQQWGLETPEGTPLGAQEQDQQLSIEPDPSQQGQDVRRPRG